MKMERVGFQADTTQSQRTRWGSAALLALSCYLLFIPAIGFLPSLGAASNVTSAASAAGYNNRLAHLLAVAVIVITAVAFAYWAKYRHPQVSSSRPVTGVASVPWQRVHVLEAALIGAITMALYWPAILSRTGPFIEDSYFLTAGHRLAGGLQPFRDFEFVYGPLMLYASNLGALLWGYSMQSYYTVLCVLEVLVFLIVFMVVRSRFASARARWSAFLFLAVILFDTLLGFNWNGLRRLLPVLILLTVSLRPASPLALGGAAVLTAVTGAYSHDLGIATVVTLVALYGFISLRERRIAPLVRGSVLITAAAALWGFLLWVLLRDLLPDYFSAVIAILSRFGSGEAGFGFYWTLNSLAGFAFLTLASALIGAGLARKDSSELPAAGDLLLFAGLIYAIITLRSGLNRADMWHLGSSLLGLFFAFLLPLPSTLFPRPRAVQRLATGLLVVFMLTYALALLPTASYLAQGWWQGVSELRRDPSLHVSQQSMRAVSIEPERARPTPELISLGAFLNESDRRTRPVILYGEAWSLDKRIGVFKSGYVTDSLLLSDEAGFSIRALLERQPGTLVVMECNAYERLIGTRTSLTPTGYYAPTPVKTLASILSSVHFRAAPLEGIARERRWERTIGSYIRQHYHPIRSFGPFLVLERRSAFS